MINKSNRIYSVSEIKNLIKGEWAEDLKNFYNNAPTNIKAYIDFLSCGSIKIPKNDSVQDNNISALTLSHDTPVLVEKSIDDISTTFDNNKNIPSNIPYHSNDDKQQESIHIADEPILERKKPTSSLTFFYKATPPNKSKKKSQAVNSPMLLHTFDGYDCPICKNKLYVTNVIIQFSAKNEIKFSVDHCKRCNKHFMSKERIEELKIQLLDKPNFEYSIIDYEEKNNEKNT